MKTLKTILMLSTICACGAGTPAAENGTSDAINYQPCPPTLPAGCEMAVLDGNPAGAGSYTIRIRTTGAFAIAPHVHSKSAKVSIVEGTMNVGQGEAMDKTQGKSYSAGASYSSPASTAHFIWSDGPVTVELTGEGPRTMSLVGESHDH